MPSKPEPIAARRAHGTWTAIVLLAGTLALGCNGRSVPYGPLTRTALESQREVDVLDALLRRNFGGASHYDRGGSDEQRLLQRLVSWQGTIAVRQLAALSLTGGPDYSERTARDEDAEIWLRMTAAYVLGSANDAETRDSSIDKAASIIRTRALPDVIRYAALLGLLQRGTRRAGDALAAIATDESDDTPVRRLALSKLLDSGHDEQKALTILTQALRSPRSDDEIRLAVAEAYAGWRQDGSEQHFDATIERALANLALADATPADLRIVAFRGVSNVFPFAGLDGKALDLYASAEASADLREASGSALRRSGFKAPGQAATHLTLALSPETPERVAEHAWELLDLIPTDAPALSDAIGRRLDQLVALVSDPKTTTHGRLGAASLLRRAAKINSLRPTLATYLPKLQPIVLQADAMPDGAPQPAPAPPLTIEDDVQFSDDQSLQSLVIGGLVELADVGDVARFLTTTIASKAAPTAARQLMMDALSRNAPGVLTPAMLRAVFADRSESVAIRGSALDALARLGANAQSVEDVTLSIAGDKKESVNVREAAIRSLLETGSPNARARLAPILTAALFDEANGWNGYEIRQFFARLDATPASELPTLVNALRGGANPRRKLVVEIVARLSTALAKEGRIDALRLLEDADQLLTTEDDKEHRGQLQQSIKYLRTARIALLWPAFAEFFATHYVITATLAYLVLGLGLTLSLLFKRPLTLKRLNDAIGRLPELKLPSWLGGYEIPARGLFIPFWFRHSPRVLDAWVESVLESARAEFAVKDPVRLREIRVPSPVRLKDRLLSDVTPADLREPTSNPRFILSIEAEGGAGKSNLAFQIAKWAMSAQASERWRPFAMLPVLIDFELTDGESSLLSAIRTQVGTLSRSSKDAPEELTRDLLESQRILLIADRFSELSTATQRVIRDGIQKLSIRALLVTARHPQEWAGAQPVRLEPVRIRGSAISSFVGDYLTRHGVRDQFPDAEFFSLCGKLSAVVGEQRDVTIMFATMFLDGAIDRKRRPDGAEEAPQTIPDLISRYVEHIWAVSDRAYDLTTTHQMLRLVAWVCVRNDLRVANARKRDVDECLGEERVKKLSFLTQQLRLIQIVGVAKDQIRFALDPVAEYLAAMYFLTLALDAPKEWTGHVARLDAVNQAKNPGTASFINAIRDTCDTGFLPPPAMKASERLTRILHRTSDAQTVA